MGSSPPSVNLIRIFAVPVTDPFGEQYSKDIRGQPAGRFLAVKRCKKCVKPI